MLVHIYTYTYIQIKSVQSFSSRVPPISRYRRLAGWLVNRRLLVRSLFCVPEKHLTLAAPDELMEHGMVNSAVCMNGCKSLWMNASAKFPKCKYR